MPSYRDMIDELLQHGTSTLCEASGLPSALDYNIRPVWPGAIAPCDLVVADADGVVAIPQAQVERTLAGARQRAEKEAAIMRRLQAGETTVQILGLKGGK